MPTYDDALHVPRSAVFEVAGKRSVYLRTPAGFEAREVKVVAFTEARRWSRGSSRTPKSR